MATNKKKLLIVSAIPPFPKTSGGAVRIYNELRWLSEAFEIYFVSFKDSNYKFSPDESDFLRKHTKHSVFFPFGHRDAGADFDNKIPYWFSPWYNSELRLYVNQIVQKENIELCQIEFTQLLYLVEDIINVKKMIFVAHDISTISFERRLAELNPGLIKLTHWYRWKKVYEYEERLLPLFDVVISMSNNDKSELSRRFQIKQVVVIPNGIEKIDFFKKQTAVGLSVGYIGSFNHPPNRYAFEYFVKNIAPLLDQKKITYKYYLAGDSDASEVDRLISQKNPHFTSHFENMGRVEKVKDFYSKINLLVAPIFSGSGTRIKILESLSYGIPVATTTIGAEGLIDTFGEPWITKATSNIDFFNLLEQFKPASFSDLEILKKSLSKVSWENHFRKQIKMIEAGL